VQVASAPIVDGRDGARDQQAGDPATMLVSVAVNATTPFFVASQRATGRNLKPKHCCGSIPTAANPVSTPPAAPLIAAANIPFSHNSTRVMGTLDSPAVATYNLGNASLLARSALWSL
jgi:hypothetical protein